MQHVINVGGPAMHHEVHLWWGDGTRIEYEWSRSMVEQLEKMFDENEVDVSWRGHRIDFGVRHPSPEIEAVILAAVRQLLPDGDTLKQIGTWAEEK